MKGLWAETLEECKTKLALGRQWLALHEPERAEALFSEVIQDAQCVGQWARMARRMQDSEEKDSRDCP